MHHNADDDSQKQNQNQNQKPSQSRAKQTDIQQRLQTLLTDLQLDDAPAGGAVVVYQAGQCVAQASVGMARRDVAWQPDTLAINFSTGKGILATLVHVLVSQRLLAYDVPIAQYWPAFAANDKGDITLRQVMSHQANLFSINSVEADSDAVLNWYHMIEKVALMPITKPDAADTYTSAYSALIYGWVLGGLVEVVTKMPLAQALSHYLTSPLGIADSCYFGVPDHKIDQVAKLAKTFDDTDNSDSQPSHKKRQKPTLTPDSQNTLRTYQGLPSFDCWQHHHLAANKTAGLSQDEAQKGSLDSGARLDTARINHLYFQTHHLNLKNYKAALIPAGKQPIDYYKDETLQAVIPAANGVASAQALAVIYGMLANGGTWQGQTLIDAETFAQLSLPHVTGLDAVMPAAMNWRLGYHRMFHICQHRTPLKGHDSGQGFGHMGYNGSVAWCDPAQQLAFAFIHNFDVTMLNDVRQFALTEAVLDMFSTS